MPEHNMSIHCRSEGFQPADVLNSIIENHKNVISMAFYK